MLIAIPVFGTRVSPRFDITRKFLVIDIEDGRVTGRQEASFDSQPPLRRILFLKEQGVDTLLCGGIRRCDYFMIDEMRISIYASLIGEVEEILSSFIDGSLEPGFGKAFGGPGIRRREGHRLGQACPNRRRQRR